MKFRFSVNFFSKLRGNVCCHRASNSRPPRGWYLDPSFSRPVVWWWGRSWRPHFRKFQHSERGAKRQRDRRPPTSAADRQKMRSEQTNMPNITHYRTRFFSWFLVLKEAKPSERRFWPSCLEVDVNSHYFFGFSRIYTGNLAPVAFLRSIPLLTINIKAHLTSKFP